MIHISKCYIFCAICLPTIVSDWVEIPQAFEKPIKTNIKSLVGFSTTEQNYNQSSSAFINKMKLENFTNVRERNFDNGLKSKNKIRLILRNSSIDDESHFDYRNANIPNDTKVKSKSDMPVIIKSHSTIEKVTDTENKFLTESSISNSTYNLSKIHQNDIKNKFNYSTSENSSRKSNAFADRQGAWYHAGSRPGNPSISVGKFEYVMNIIKAIQHTIRNNINKTLRSKIQYLRTLRHNILEVIEKRLNALWPDKEVEDGTKHRQARESHVEIPSAESALMSISFLTFAVFLIKLVLQVIQAYKMKTVVTPFFTTVGRVINSRPSRSISHTQQLELHKDILDHMMLQESCNYFATKFECP